MKNIDSGSKRQTLQRRKRPVQQRSRFTVDSILQATKELIDTEGFENVGTARIAARAGVLLGSLYHYFPNYESILLALYEEVAAKAWQKMKFAMLSNVEAKMEIAAPKTIRLLLDLYEENQLVLLEMPAKVPAIKQATESVSLESLLRGSIRNYLQQHPRHRAKDLDRQLFFIDTIVFASLRQYILAPSPPMPRAKFIAELSAIATGYLKKDLDQ